MKIVFIPDWRGNAYQSSLADCLIKKNNEVIFGLNYGKICVIESVYANWKPEILHLHWPDQYIDVNKRSFFYRSILFLIQLVVIKILGIKIVWTVHNLVSHEARFKKWELMVCKIIAKIANKIIVHSRYAKSQVENVYNVKNDSKINIIPHAHYIARYKNTISRQEARDKLCIDKNDKVFLFFGMIRPYKGITELINSFCKLNRKGVALVIAGSCGDKSFEKEIKGLALKNQNIFLDIKRIDDDDIQIYMNCADFVVLPFRKIFTSGSVMLALSFSKSVIVPAIGPIPELLGKTKNILYDVAKENALIDALARAIGKDSESIGKENYDLIKHLSWEYVAKKTENVYKTAIGQK